MTPSREIGQIRHDEPPARSTCSDTPITIGEWRVDAPANELSRDGATIKIEPKAMRVLCLLAARPGAVVTREELEAQAWPRMVVTTDAVTSAIIKLRKALGDDSRNPRYIETVSKRGYRLIADVKPAAIESTAPVRVRRLTRRRRSWALILALTLLIVLSVLWLTSTRHEMPAPGPLSGAQSLEHKPGIAVLPFENLGATPKHDYFADGMTEDLTTDLSKLSGLRVIARDSALAYRESADGESVIARKLGVDYLLRGSVQRSGRRLRINVRLIDGKTAANLWGDRYDREIDDIFEIQDEIAARIVSALELTIAPADRSRMTRNHLANVQAYDEFLRGLDHFNRGSPDETQVAMEHYQRAIAMAPGFARAYAALAMVYTRDFIFGWHLTQSDALSQAAELAEKARRLDPSVPQIYFVDGYVELFRRNYDAAIRHAEDGLSIKPSYADAYALLAWILHFAGRPTEGLASMQHAIRLNPRAPALYRAVKGALYYSIGEIDEAVAELEAAAQINPSYQLVRTWLAAAYAAAGRLDEAQWECQEILALDPTFSTSHVEQTFPIRDPAYRERLVDDLRRAGMPD